MGAAWCELSLVRSGGPRSGECGLIDRLYDGMLLVASAGASLVTVACCRCAAGRARQREGCLTPGRAMGATDARRAGSGVIAGVAGSRRVVSGELG